MTSQDWFAPAEPAIRLHNKVDDQMDHVGDPFFSAGRAGLGTYGNGPLSAVPLQQQVQTPGTTRGPPATHTIDGFEIVSTGYYFQREGNREQGGFQRRM